MKYTKNESHIHKLYFPLYNNKNYTRNTTHSHTRWDRNPHWNDERLIMSSNTVWVRPQLMFTSINKLIWRFGNLTLMPASFSLYLLFLYLYFSSSSMSVNAQSLHKQKHNTQQQLHTQTWNGHQYLRLPMKPLRRSLLLFFNLLCDPCVGHF